MNLWILQTACARFAGSFHESANHSSDNGNDTGAKKEFDTAYVHRCCRHISINAVAWCIIWVWWKIINVSHTRRGAVVKPWAWYLYFLTLSTPAWGKHEERTSTVSPFLACGKIMTLLTNVWEIQDKMNTYSSLCTLSTNLPRVPILLTHRGLRKILVSNQTPLIYRNRPKMAVNATGALVASGSRQPEQQPLLGAGNWGGSHQCAPRNTCTSANHTHMWTFCT